MNGKFFKILTVLLLITVVVLPTSASAQVVKKKKVDFTKAKLKMPKMVLYNIKNEQLKCLGFYPERNMLKAMVDVKLSTGYSGNLCNKGSFEYVRFYVDWNGDGDYLDAGEDVGVAGLNVHDIPDIKNPCLNTTKPLSFALSLVLKPKRYSCPTPYLVKVRAILSWNEVPPAMNPAYRPLRGNAIERWIQIKPKYITLMKSIGKTVDLKKSKLTPEELEKLPLPKLKTLQPNQLKTMYQAKNVPELRFNFKAINSVAMKIKKSPSLKAKYAADPKYKAIMKYTNLVLLPKPNINFEQLTCVGLYYTRDILAATLNIKRSYGYNGELCKAQGSYEFVAFWIYYMNPVTKQCRWKYAGTARVNVHDIKNLPRGGLNYAVYQPFDFSGIRQNCNKPVVLKVRAILSWNTKPPTNNPNYKPVWGNVREALIQIKPGELVQPGLQKPYITHVGMMPVEGIAGNFYTMIPSALGPGYANGVSIDEGFTAEESPFGGIVTICGTISNPPNNPSEAARLKYKVQYRKAGTLHWHNITRKFKVWINIDSVPSGYINQVADSNGYFKYQKDLTPPKIVEIRNDTLAVWQTPAPEDDGLYEIRMVLKKGVLQIPSKTIRIMVDNTKPNPADIALVAGACTIFKIPTVINGKFRAYDKHFWKYSISLAPYAPPKDPANPTKYFWHKPTPTMKLPYGVAGKYKPLPPYGVNIGTFRLDTSTLMKQCGYVFYLHVWDRTIRNNYKQGNRSGDSVGFCLVK
jgi:hypothetical protein